MSETMKHTVGQTITVMRGKTRGKSATVMGVDEANSQYAVKYPDGTFGVINAVNVKEPVEATIGEAKLAAEIQTLAADLDGFKAHGVLEAFVSRLSMPGLGARISWPASE